MTATKSMTAMKTSLITIGAALLLTAGQAIAGENDSKKGSTLKPTAKSASTTSTIKQFYVRGLDEANKKNWADAVTYYDEALRLDPNYGEALGNRGAARFNLHDYNGALSDYNAAIKIFPDNKALKDLKAQVEGVMNENARATAAQQNTQQSANQIRIRSVLGGDLADPSTQIMMNAQRRGLIQAPAVDYSDPASIIMENARRRGLVPANTPNP